LLHIHEWFTRASEIGDLLYQLCLAYVASYIFYMLVTVLPRRRDLSNLNGYLKEKKRKIVSEHLIVVNHMIQEVKSIQTKQASSHEELLRKTKAIVLLENHVLDIDNLSYDDFRIMCQVLNPYLPSPSLVVNPNIRESVMRQLSWDDLLKHSVSVIKKEISESLILIPYLDSKYIKVLSELQDSRFINMVSVATLFTRMDDPSLSIIDDPIYEFYLQILALNDNWFK
jgi:hypothetical protein